MTGISPLEEMAEKLTIFLEELMEPLAMKFQKMHPLR
jgi:hypothetical protein